MYDTLFSPIKVRGLTLRNRVVMTAMGSHFPDEDSYVTQQLIDYQVARALGGVGLNYMECCSVNKEARVSRQPSIAEDRFIAGHKAMCDAVHTAGGKCAIQLWAPGAGAGSDPNARIYLPQKYEGRNFGVATHFAGLPEQGESDGTQAADNVEPYPFFVPPWGKHEADGTIPAVTVEELHMIVEEFGAAARRSVEAGYDMLEFHCGHNYLPHTMLSGAFNKRTDEYGGCLENRMRFPLECIKALRENMPKDMPLSIRISVFDEPDLPGGNTIEDNIVFLKKAKEAGVDIVNVSRGNFSGDGNPYEVPPLNFEYGFNVENAARIRQETGLVTMAVGRINRPWVAENILQSGKADMVAMSRAQLADPEFCNKARDGRCEEIRYCVGCNQGCSDGFTGLPHITCLRNPLLGRESELKLVKAENKKKVLIIGGGMGGMECALFLKKRGHEPIIVEKAEKLGGQFVLAGMAPQKHEFIAATEDEARMVKSSGIEVRLNTEADKALIDEIMPDEIVIATGAGPLLIPIPGADLPHVSNAHQILGGKATATGKVVIVGGGIVGVEVAEYLSSMGLACKIIEMKDSVASDLGYYRMMLSQKYLAEHDVECIVNAACKEIREKAIIYMQDGVEKQVDCDSVVIAAGAKPLPIDGLKAAAEALNIPYHVIGDAVSARRALNAIAEGVETAMKI